MLEAPPQEPPAMYREALQEIAADLKEIMKIIDKIKIEILIRRMASEQGIDPEKAVLVAVKESSLNPQAVNVNRNGSRDRGLWQINDRAHPTVTDALAFDSEWSTRFFLEAVKKGKVKWWVAAKGIFFDA